MILGLDVSTSITGATILDKEGEVLYNEAWDTRKFKNFFVKAAYIEEKLYTLINFTEDSKKYLSNNLSKLSGLDSPPQKLCQLSLVLMGLCHGLYIEYCRQNQNI